MGGTLKYDGQLRDFAGAVPEQAAQSAAFTETTLTGHMAGVAQAAFVHATKVLAAETFVTQANTGLEAYKQGATSADAAYNSTDAGNAGALERAAGASAAGMQAGPAVEGLEPDMPSLAQLNPAPRQG